jgi:hypothetical protein
MTHTGQMLQERQLLHGWALRFGGDFIADGDGNPLPRANLLQQLGGNVTMTEVPCHAVTFQYYLVTLKQLVERFWICFVALFDQLRVLQRVSGIGQRAFLVAHDHAPCWREQFADLIGGRLDGNVQRVGVIDPHLRGSDGQGVRLYFGGIGFPRHVIIRRVGFFILCIVALALLIYTLVPAVLFRSVAADDLAARCAELRVGEMSGVLLPCPEVSVGMLERGSHFGTMSAVLFVEEGDSLLETQVADTTRPRLLHPAMLVRALSHVLPGFAADDDPMNAAEVGVQRVGTEQGFGADELDLGTGLAEMVNALDDPFIFDAGSHPDVIAPRRIGSHSVLQRLVNLCFASAFALHLVHECSVLVRAHSGKEALMPVDGGFGTLGENLEYNIIPIQHQGEANRFVPVGDSAVEHIGHGVDKHAGSGGDVPAVDLDELVRFHHDIIALVLLRPRLLRPAAIQRELHRVTMLASVRDDRTSMNEIPCEVRPVDSGLVHQRTPFVQLTL